MRRDVIADMEELTGKHHSEFTRGEEALVLIAAAAEARRVEAEMQAIGDTHWGLSWQEFKNLLTANGFNILLVDKFKPGRYGHDPDREEELLVAFDPKRCLLLKATSYGLSSDRPHINGGSVYGEVCAPKPPTKQGMSILWRGLSGCSNGPEGNDSATEVRRHFDYDIREGLFSQLMTISLSGWQYADTWTKGEHQRHLWLLDYGQEYSAESEPEFRKRCTFYDRCTQERIDRLPADVRQRIGR